MKPEVDIMTPLRRWAPTIGILAIAGYLASVAINAQPRNIYVSTALTGLATDVLTVPESAADPAAGVNQAKLYSKDVAGTTQMFVRASDGTVTQITPQFSVTLEDENVPVAGAPHTIYNFTGGGVTVTNAGGGEATFTIPTPTLAFQDEGVAQGSASTVDVVGGGASVAVAGSTATLTVPTPTIAVQDSGVAQGSASTFNFTGNIVASVAGSTATIDVSSGAEPFGNGADGDINFDGTSPVTFGTGLGAQSLAISGSTYTLTRDVFANNLTVANGIEVRTAGYGVFVRATLTVNGTLGERGNNGSNGTNPGATGGGGAGGTAVHADANRRYWGGNAGGNGGGADAGTGSSGNAGLPANPTPMTSASGSVAANSPGGRLQGGGGGNNNLGASASGIAANTYAANTSTAAFQIISAINGRPATSTSQWQAGSSGAGGRGAGSSIGGGGGGGGASCPPVGIFARIIAGSGTLRAIGGNGGNGSNGGGGGGGGAGGVLEVATQSAFPLSVTLSVAGGSGGNGGGTGSTTSGGNAGDGQLVTYNP